MLLEITQGDETLFAVLLNFVTVLFNGYGRLVQFVRSLIANQEVWVKSKAWSSEYNYGSICTNPLES